MIAISTAFKEAQIALKLGDKTALRQLDANCKHSENVLFAINQMLDEIGENINNNESYAVVVGPGSFTGLRIGIALVKGLCATSGKKVVTLSSFDLIAYSYIKAHKPSGNFMVLINALSGLVFARLYDSEGKALEEGKLVKLEEVPSDIACVSLEEDALIGEKVTLSAQELLSLALIKEKEGILVDAHSVSPIYLRKSQAEAQLEEKSSKKVEK